MWSNVNIAVVTTASTDRRSYHHGDLRNALVRAARDLAEEGGPDAVTIRAAARAVGVTPTATYRHFANQIDLLCAARDDAMEQMAAVILDLVPPADPDADPLATALGTLTAAGRGYVRFALENPGLYRTAFCRVSPEEDDGEPLETRLAAAPPYAFLSSALDGLVAAGWTDPAQRKGAEAGAWAAVHGLSMLMLDGPFQALDDAGREAAIATTLSMVLHGLASGPRGERPAGRGQ